MRKKKIKIQALAPSFWEWTIAILSQCLIRLNVNELAIAVLDCSEATCIGFIYCLLITVRSYISLDIHLPNYCFKEFVNHLLL